MQLKLQSLLLRIQCFNFLTPRLLLCFEVGHQLLTSLRPMMDHDGVRVCDW